MPATTSPHGDRSVVPSPVPVPGPVLVPDAGAAVVLPGAANVRDLGGWPVAGGGVVRRDRVFRGAGLDGLDDAGRAALAATGVRTVFDLRTAGEIAARPDALPDGVRHVVLDVLADSPQVAAAGAADFFSGPSAAASLDRDFVLGAFAQTYRDFVRLPSAHAAYRGLFQGLLDASGPVLFHCTTGKDRTGWATAALLLLLGVPHEDVEHEYLLSGERLAELVRPLYDAFAAVGGDASLLDVVLGVRPEYLAAALDEATTAYGGVDGWFTGALGLGPDAQDALRAALVDGSPGAA